jgi:hypothetical protein
MSAFPREIYRPQELDEVLGVLHHVEDLPDGGLIALIGKIPTWLPSELGPRLKELQGRKIGVLRLDGYRIKEI